MALRGGTIGHEPQTPEAGPGPDTDRLTHSHPLALK